MSKNKRILYLRSALSQEKSFPNSLNDKRIKSFCLSRNSTAAFKSPAVFCLRSTILSAVIRSPYSCVSTADAAVVRTKTTTAAKCALWHHVRFSLWCRFCEQYAKMKKQTVVIYSKSLIEVKVE